MKRAADCELQRGCEAEQRVAELKRELPVIERQLKERQTQVAHETSKQKRLADDAAACQADMLRLEKSRERQWEEVQSAQMAVSGAVTGMTRHAAMMQKAQHDLDVWQAGVRETEAKLKAQQQAVDARAEEVYRKEQELEVRWHRAAQHVEEIEAQARLFESDGSLQCSSLWGSSVEGGGHRVERHQQPGSPIGQKLPTKVRSQLDDGSRNEPEGVNRSWDQRRSNSPENQFQGQKYKGYYDWNQSGGYEPCDDGRLGRLEAKGAVELRRCGNPADRCRFERIASQLHAKMN